MGEKFKIVIEVEGGTHRIKVVDDAGNVKECSSCVVTAGNSETGELYTFAWGHPREAAWSLGEGLARGQANPWWGGFIQSLVKEMAFRTLKLETLSGEELVDRWEKGSGEEAEKKARIN